jgi:hypothetical protein
LRRDGKSEWIAADELDVLLLRSNPDFTEAVICALEQKVRYMGFYRRRFSNLELATL